MTKTGVSKRTIECRTFTTLVALALGFTAVWTPSRAADAQEETWTVEELVERALGAPQIAAITELETEAAYAEVNARVAMPNPELELLHEQVLGDNSASYRESTATIRQQFDLSGWRSRYRETATHNESAIRARREAWQLDVATSVRTAFYSVRYRQERLLAMDSWLQRLDERFDGLSARVERGDASTFALRRVEVERLTVHGMRAEEQSKLAEAMADLMVWLPTIQTPLALSGDITPDDAAVHGPSAPADIQALPSLRALAAEELSLSSETERWRSPFFRGWEVGAGYRLANVRNDNAHGFLVSLTVPLTFWNPNKAQLERLEAVRARVEQELSFQNSQASTREDAARRRLEVTMRQLESVSNTDVQSELVELAELAFGSGEAPLIELLDAYESLTQLQLTTIDLEWEARRASIQWRRTRGTGAQQE